MMLHPLPEPLRRSAWLLCALAAVVSPACAAEPAGLKVSDAWMRFIMPSRPAAGYFTLTNPGTDTYTLTGASSPACASLMMHRSMQDGGMAHMEMVESVTVPAHGHIAFA